MTWRGRLVRGVLGLVGAFALLEVGFRVWLFHLAPEEKLAKYGRPADIPLERRRYVPHPYLDYCLNPVYRSRDGLDRHNALGFRGDDFPLRKPAGTYRIACVGGSSTYDTEIRDWRKSFAVRLEALLREQYGHSSVQVINAGVGGYNSWETMLYLQLRVFEIEPDLVVYYENTNDAHARLVPPEVYRRDNTGHRKSWEELDPWWDRSQVVRYLGVQWGFSQRTSLEERVKVEWSQELDPLACLAANPPVYLEENLANMAVLARDRGVQMLLSTWAHCEAFDDYAAVPHYVQAFRENNEAIQRVAERMQVPFYDFASEMPTDQSYWVDGRHNNEKGAQKKAELFAAYMHAQLLDGVL